MQPGKQFANVDKVKSPTRADIHFGCNGAKDSAADTANEPPPSKGPTRAKFTEEALGSRRQFV